MNTNVIHEVIREASISLSAILMRRTGDCNVRVMYGDDLPIGYVPYAFTGSIGDVELGPLGPAFYEATADEIRACLTPAVRAVRNRAEMGRIVERLYPGVKTVGLRSMHGFAAVVHMGYQLAHLEGLEIQTGGGKVLHVPAIGLLIDQQRIEYDGTVRRTPEVCPSLEMIVHQPSGHYRRTTPGLGAVYRHILMTLPELAPHTKTLVTAAYLTGLGRLVTNQFEMQHMVAAARNKDLWAQAFNLAADNPDRMPWSQIQNLVGHLMTPPEFREHLRTPSDWAAARYTRRKQGQVMAKLVELQTRDSHAQKFTENEKRDRQRAFQILQLQQQVR